MDYVHPFSSTKNHHERSGSLGRCISLLACSQPLRSASRMPRILPVLLPLPARVFWAAPRQRPRSLEKNRAAMWSFYRQRLSFYRQKWSLGHQKASFDLLKHGDLNMKHGDLNVKHVDLTIKHLQLTIQRMTYE
jgi:hypothetical protein